MKSANPTARDLRRINRQTVFHYLYVQGPMSRMEISQFSGLSAGTIANVVAELLAEELVQEAGFEASEGGRPRTILTLNMEYGYFIGSEIGETEVVIELFDIKLQKLKSMIYPLIPEENNPQTVVQRFVSGVEDVLAQAQIPHEKVLGMGVGVPGVVEQAEEETVAAPAWDWQPTPLKAMLGQHFQIPLYVDNGSKVMALAEMHMQPDMLNKTIIALNVGTGVGAGVIYEGKLYRGGNNSAGEWGHTTIVLDGELCRCGHRGCLEAYTGAPAIIRHLRESAPASPILASDDEVQMMTDLMTAAQHGDPTAKQVLLDTVHYLGAGLANLINLFNPQQIILGGWVGLGLGEQFLPELLRETRRHALKQPFEATRIQVSQLGRDAASLGAARLALEAFLMHVGQPAGQPLLARAMSQARLPLGRS
ncbi:MAG: ROK family protein [Ktedonobacteraceae bacterium]|nr:ROK family protein [Ktedonobacteraceae bacterium]